MSSVTLGGTRYSIKDDIPAAGMPASDFTFVKSDLSEGNLYDDYEGKVKVLIAVPSLDTRVCQTETRHFNEALAARQDKGVIGLIISKDLPFAMNRFCEAEGIENVIVASDYRYNDFINEYNTEILSGPFKGLSARAVFVVDQKNVLRYSELVPEIGQEPQYDHAIKAIDELIG
jgi:thiol peroxidase